MSKVETFAQQLQDIEEAQRDLDARRADVKRAIIEEVRTLIRTYKLTTDDITVPAPGEELQEVRPVKYRDADGNTWTGRGRKPKWLIDALVMHS